MGTRLYVHQDLIFLTFIRVVDALFFLCRQEALHFQHVEPNSHFGVSGDRSAGVLLCHRVDHERFPDGFLGDVVYLPFPS